MAYPDSGPLLDEHLDELELICLASENEGQFPPGAKNTQGLEMDGLNGLIAVDYVLGWYDRHGRQLLKIARWAMQQGYTDSQ